MVCSPPGSSVHGILQARILKWVAISISRGSFRYTDQTHISCTGKQMLWHWATKETLTLPLVKDWKFPPIQLSTYPNPLTPMSETGELTLEDPLGEMEPRGGAEHSKKLCEQGGLSVLELSELSVLIWWTVSVIWQLFLYSWQVSITCCLRVWRLFNWKGMKIQLLCWTWPFAKNLKHTPFVQVPGFSFTDAHTAFRLLPSCLRCSSGHCNPFYPSMQKWDAAFTASVPSLCAPLSSQTATLCAATVRLTSTIPGAAACSARMPGACCWGTAVSLIALLATSWREELVKVSAGCRSWRCPVIFFLLGIIPEKAWTSRERDGGGGYLASQGAVKQTS